MTTPNESTDQDAVAYFLQTGRMPHGYYMQAGKYGKPRLVRRSPPSPAPTPCPWDSWKPSRDLN